jgi:chaperonin GroEL
MIAHQNRLLQSILLPLSFKLIKNMTRKAKHTFVQNLVGSNPDQDTGIRIVMRAVEAPLRAIAYNAGASPDVVVNAVLQGTGNYGYNAATDTYGDLVEQGVIDPTKVTRTALVNAASIAGLLLTTECSINNVPQDHKAGGEPGMPALM